MLNLLFGGAHVTFGVRELVGGLVLYVYIAYTMMILAQRLHHQKDAWMAWVPLANLYLMTKMGGQPWWWAFGIIITPINLFVVPFLWFTVAGRLGKNPWVGAAIIIPLVGLFIPGYLVITTDQRK
jgi:hypothetical protein